MKFFFLLALACFVSAAEEHLLFSGKFNTIYLAGKYVSITAENRPTRMLMREVKFFDQYRLMSMKFYVRKNGKCELHTVWADKLEQIYCPVRLALFVANPNQKECRKRNSANSITGIWMLRDSIRHFPNIYTYPPPRGGMDRVPSIFYIEIHFVSNTTILFEGQYENESNYEVNLSGALATGTNITEEMWKEYVKLTKKLGIPTENIVNVYETDMCPK